MNNDSQTSEITSEPIYCPSCAARISENPEQNTKSGELLQCPVCGTKFSLEPNQTADPKISESDVASSPKAVRRLSTEQILLERLKNEPPQKKPIRWNGFAVILAILLVVAFGISRIASKPDKYAPGQIEDTSMVLQKRLFFQHIIDSLNTELAAHPTDVSIHLSLADALYDDQRWDESMKQFETYLAAKPSDPDARVDYAYTIAQANGNLNDAIAEIDTALIYKPDHLNALINAGIMTAQTVNDSNHTEALAKARNYFVRARTVAQKTDPGIAARIDTLIQEIDNTGSRLAK